MKIFALAIPIAIWLVMRTAADDEIKCTREGRICLNCTTMAYCEKVGEAPLVFNATKIENCVVDFVCDEWNLQCVRRGTCRSAPFSCPTFDSILLPDPYSCSGYYSCAEAYPYQCGDGLVFRDNTCVKYDNDKSCNDYPVLCEKPGQTQVVDGYKFVCKEEVINGVHTIHPEVQL